MKVNPTKKDTYQQTAQTFCISGNISVLKVLTVIKKKLIIIMFIYFVFHLTEKHPVPKTFSEYEMIDTVGKPANPRTYDNDYYLL
jgi:hypothetical protein